MIGSLFIVCICFILFLKNIESITKINSVIVPILIVTILIIGTKNLININFNEIGRNIKENNSLYYVIEAIIYSSYNLILIIPVLINLKKFLKSKKQIIIISIMSEIFVAIISILTFLLLVNVDKNFFEIEMPVVYVVKNKFTSFTYIYGIIILIAIFTTAISVGISFLNNIRKSKFQFVIIAFLLCITSILVSPIGFANLVKILFPLFGYLGLLQIYFIIKSK